MPPQPDAVEIRQLIREELDRNNRYLEFAQGQITQDRAFYKHLYTYTGAFIALMVGVAVYFTYSNVSQMRSDMRASADAEVAALRAQANAANLEAKATIAKELADVRAEVQKRLDTEFQSDTIKAQIATAAKERTETEFTGIIRSVASDAVTKGIQAEHPFIQKTVEDQTRESVNALQPTINTLVKAATEAQVNKVVLPVQTQMAAYGDYIRIGTLAMLANGDDRHAFDTLLLIATGKTKESANPDFLHLADSTAGSIVAAKESGIRMTRSFKEAQTPDSLKTFMRSSYPFERVAALDSYPPSDRSILPILVEMIKTDGSIDVLVRAVEHFNALTKQSFRFLQTTELLNWWANNQKSFQ